MNTKTKALTLLAVVAVAAVAGSLIFAMQPTVKGDSSPVASDSEPTPSAVTAPSNNFTDFGGGFMGCRGHGMMDRGFGGMGFGPMAPIQVSSDFIANVTNIAKSDSDVLNLLNQGYNITSVHPVISTTIDGNGNVVTKASTAELTLEGTNGRAFVVVDLSQAKVTKIVTTTVNEIDKP
jgi:hypothetical protein